MKPHHALLFIFLFTLTPGCGKRPFTVVALGDSITAGRPGFRSALERPPFGEGDKKSQYEYWIKESRPEWKVINQGINGQRTDEILARFDRSVLRYSPDVVVVMAGTNDVHQDKDVKTIEDSLQKLYDAAFRRGIRVVACTLLPYNSSTPAAKKKIAEVNKWIRDTVSRNGLLLAETAGALQDPADAQVLTHTQDGIHPDVEGYALMGKAILEAIEQGGSG